VGSDADLVVWDPNKSKTIRAASQVYADRMPMRSKASSVPARRSPPSAAVGLPGWTAICGRKKGDGRYVERPAFPAVQVANAKWRELTRPRGVERLDVTPWAAGKAPTPMTAIPNLTINPQRLWDTLMETARMAVRRKGAFGGSHCRTRTSACATGSSSSARRWVAP
jgi:hypothetical protein